MTSAPAAPFPDLHCVYNQASGPSYTECVYFGRRHRDVYGSTAADSDFWIVVNQPENVQDGMTYPRWGPWTDFITGIWRSPSGIVYATDATAVAVQVFVDVMNQGGGYRTDELKFWPEGVWGLDDEHVYVWGTRKDAAGKLEYPIARYNGRTWTEIASPGFAITIMHGIAPDLIYAAGYKGGMARWDGGKWNVLPMPTGEVFTDVFVASADELYATGMNGSFLEGSANGWTVVARTMDDRLSYTCVAKWNGEVWVGGGPLGLFRRVGKTNQLELVKDKVHPSSFDARKDLVITCANRIVGTSDGVNFRASGKDILMQLTGTMDIAKR
jgi:hypothetical protein